MPLDRSEASLPSGVRDLIQDTLSAETIIAGFNEAFADGRVDKKILSWSVLAQAYDGTYSIQVDQGKRLRTQEGGAFLVSPHKWLSIGHHAKRGAKQSPMKARWLHFHFTVFGAYDFLSLFDLPLVLTSAQAEPFGKIIAELLRLQSTASLAQIAVNRQLAFQFLAELMKIARLKPDSLALLVHSGPLAPVLSHIHRHLTGSYDAKDLARMGGLSLSHLHALFKKQLGVSPMEYVKAQRLAHAKARLGASEEKISVIAENAGFKSAFHFSRVFKERFGLTPSEFRAQDHRSV